MLKFSEKMLAGQFAYHAAEMTLGAFVWTFKIYEHDDCNELHIIDPANQRRRMGKEKFENLSQARSAANEFVKEFLA